MKKVYMTKLLSSMFHQRLLAFNILTVLGCTETGLIFPSIIRKAVAQDDMLTFVEQK